MVIGSQKMVLVCLLVVLEVPQNPKTHAMHFGTPVSVLKHLSVLTSTTITLIANLVRILPVTTDPRVLVVKAVTVPATRVHMVIVTHLVVAVIVPDAQALVVLLVLEEETALETVVATRKDIRVTRVIETPNGQDIRRMLVVLPLPVNLIRKFVSIGLKVLVVMVLNVTITILVFVVIGNRILAKPFR